LQRERLLLHRLCLLLLQLLDLAQLRSLSHCLRLRTSLASAAELQFVAVAVAVVPLLSVSVLQFVLQLRQATVFHLDEMLLQISLIFL
jgi:hypothetical protein